MEPSSEGLAEDGSQAGPGGSELNLEKLRQEDSKFKASLGYEVSGFKASLDNSVKFGPKEKSKKDAAERGSMCSCNSRNWTRRPEDQKFKVIQKADKSKGGFLAGKVSAGSTRMKTTVQNPSSHVMLGWVWQQPVTTCGRQRQGIPKQAG